MQYRASIILALLLAAISSDVIGAEFVLLKPKDIPELMKQCSRSAPIPSSQGWVPTQKMIDEIKHELQKSPILKNDRLQDLEKYNFQIVGIFIKGKRAIYINGVGVSAWKGIDHNKPIVACDGGNLFFGVLYNPIEKSFDHLSINGPSW